MHNKGHAGKIRQLALLHNLPGHQRASLLVISPAGLCLRPFDGREATFLSTPTPIVPKDALYLVYPKLF